MSAHGGGWVAAASAACLLGATTLLFNGLLTQRSAGRWDGEAFELRRGVDSAHYFVDGAINGVPLTFLVDTGASVTSVSTALAEQMNLGRCRPVELRTANGPARGCEARADAVDVGPFRLPDSRVIVGAQLGEPLLGMSVLQHFDLTQSGQRLRLTPKPGAPVGRAEGAIKARPAMRWWAIAALFAAGVAFAVRWARHHAD